MYNLVDIILYFCKKCNIKWYLQVDYMPSETTGERLKSLSRH